MKKVVKGVDKFMNAKKITQNSFFRAALAAVFLLLIPFLGSWPWTRSDFIVMGVMIFTFGLGLDLVLKKSGKHKIIAAMAIVLLFLWLWVELAVGLFTNWGS